MEIERVGDRERGERERYRDREKERADVWPGLQSREYSTHFPVQNHHRIYPFTLFIWIDGTEKRNHQDVSSTTLISNATRLCYSSHCFATTNNRSDVWYELSWMRLSPSLEGRILNWTTTCAFCRVSRTKGHRKLRLKIEPEQLRRLGRPKTRLANQAWKAETILILLSNHTNPVCEQDTV